MVDRRDLTEEIRRLATRLDERSRVVDPASVMAAKPDRAPRPSWRRPLLVVAAAVVVVLGGVGLAVAVVDDDSDGRRVDTQDAPITTDRVATTTTPTTTTSSTGSTTDVPRYDGVQWSELPERGIGIVEDGRLVLLGFDGTELASLTHPALGGLGGRAGRTVVGIPSSGMPTVLAETVQPPDGCDEAAGGGGVRVALCGGDPQRRQEIVQVDLTGDVRVLAGDAPGAPDGTGHWRWAVPSPDGRWVLAQHSGECEVPTAWLVKLPGGSAPKTVTGLPSLVGAVESIGIGWAPDSRAIVHLRGAGCGLAADEPGIYLVDPDTAERALLHAVPSDAGVVLWEKEHGLLNLPERMIARSVAELGLEVCCGEPSHGRPTASSGVLWDGVEVSVWGEPRSWEDDAGSNVVVVVCGDHRWTFGVWPFDVLPAEARAAADAIVPHLYCTVEERIG